MIRDISRIMTGQGASPLAGAPRLDS